MRKLRLDLLLVEKKIIDSRDKAQRAIMAGEILVNEERIDKPGTKIPEDAQIRFTGKTIPYVSRGGLKLEKALACFQLNLQDKVILDIGASTGGFTHCALLHGAQKVYAVDVGYGQLDWQLRNDDRVVVMERINARNLTKDMFTEKIQVVIMDVSFISITKILPVLKPLLDDEGLIMTLVKPQFEAGREHIGKKGVVKDPDVHSNLLGRIVEHADSLGFFAKKLDYSPIKGPQGNIEFLLLLTQEPPNRVDEDIIHKVVQESWEKTR